jgi:mRNA interferase RelE/StbE
MPRQYVVVILPKAQKQLAAIPEPHRAKIGKAIDALSSNPRPYGCRKLVGEILYRIRVGEYRIIYNIDDTTITVTVTKVAHRREAYRRK